MRRVKARLSVRTTFCRGLFFVVLERWRSESLAQERSAQMHSSRREDRSPGHESALDTSATDVRSVGARCASVCVKTSAELVSQPSFAMQCRSKIATHHSATPEWRSSCRPGLRVFLMTSKPGPCLFLTGGVEAFSYSLILTPPLGGEGVLLGFFGGDSTFSLLRVSARTSPSCSCRDAANAASAAICSFDSPDVAGSPPGAPAGESEDRGPAPSSLLR